MWRKQSDSFDYATPIRYNADYRRAESQSHDAYGCDSDSVDSDIEIDDDNSSVTTDDDDDDSDEHSLGIESNDDADQVVLNDKYLIFTTGFKTYTPHQIGNSYL